MQNCNKKPPPEKVTALLLESAVKISFQNQLLKGDA